MDNLRIGRRTSAKSRAAEDLLRRARRLKTQLAALDRSARSYHSLLDPEVSSAEIEAMATPEAHLLGTLECLFNSDLEAVVKKLAEIDTLLAEGSNAGA